MQHQHVLKALNALGVVGFQLSGTPTTEDEFLSMYSEYTGADDNDVAVFTSNPDDYSVTWSQVSAKVTDIQAAEPMRLLRQERDRRLAETDWWASSDLTMTTEQTTYRQALRDITDSATSLDDVTWPEKP